jgi:hypothetical protein
MKTVAAESDLGVRGHVRALEGADMSPHSEIRSVE